MTLIWIHISQEIHQASVAKICLKITYLRFLSNVPGVDELIETTSNISCWADVANDFHAEVRTKYSKPVSSKFWLMMNGNLNNANLSS